MNKIENIEAHKKLMIMQVELKAPKNLYNSYGKFNYRNAESILEAIKPLLMKKSCAVLLNEEIIEIKDILYAKCTVNLICLESGFTVSSAGFARIPDSKKGMSEEQVTGAVSSYAKKYALSNLFLLDDSKDADHDSLHPDYEKKVKNKITKETMHKIKELADTIDADLEKTVKHFKVESLEDLNRDQGDALLRKLDSEVGGQKNAS